MILAIHFNKYAGLVLKKLLWLQSNDFLIQHLHYIVVTYLYFLHSKYSGTPNGFKNHFATLWILNSLHMITFAIFDTTAFYRLLLLLWIHNLRGQVGFQSVLHKHQKIFKFIWILDGKEILPLKACQFLKSNANMVPLKTQTRT